ncbi:MAG: Oligopeptide transport system permease protein OppC [Anaerolineales bacterium]|nr:Oligopeptide transport system permease protein OppC [Anaerolineales bacterium]
MVTTASQVERQPIAAVELGRQRTLWSDAARRFAQNKLAMAGLVVALVLILTAIFADFLAPQPYDRVVLSEALQFPSRAHWLGTDAVGRDFLSRIIYGARTSLIVGFLVQIIASIIGVPLGAVAGLRGGKTDFVVTRLVEVMTAFPSFLFALFIMSVLGTGLFNVILAISVTSWVPLCRLTRGQLLSLREKEFVAATRALGAKDRRIILHHLLPNALPALIVMIALGIPTAIFAEAGLSFLGVGINDPLPSWGKMVGSSSAYIRVYWHLGLFPTLMIAITTLSFTFVGDGLRDALDPTMLK